MIPEKSKTDPGRKLTLYVRAVDEQYFDALQPDLRAKNISLSSLVTAFMKRLAMERVPGGDQLDLILDQLGYEI